MAEQSATQTGSWDKPPSKRFWVVTFAVIASVAIIVGILIAGANATSGLNEKADKLDASQACDTLPVSSDEYWDCKDEVWGDK